MTARTVRESLAALGVIASLVFVGWEIRQSNMQARAAAYQSIGIATAEAFDSWAHDREFAALNKSAAVMDTTEWRQWALKLTAFARLGETILLQVEQGLLPADAMERLGYAGWREIFSAPAYGCLWPLIRPGASEAFRRFVEQSRESATVDCSGYAIPRTLLATEGSG